MTTPATRLAEIAERLYFNFWKRNGWADPISFAEQATAIKSMWSNIAADILPELTAAQARSREDAEIMREASVELGIEWQVTSLDGESVFCERCAAVNGHTPDCLVTKIRTRADELEATP